MFNRDALFGKKDESPRTDPRPLNVNVTPSLGSGVSPVRHQPVEPTRPEVRYTDVLASHASPRAEESTGSKLIVGPDIKLRGVEITDCDTLVVEGRVEASMDSRVVQIAESGVFSGTVSIDVAEIRGQFEGELTARKQLVIYSTGRVSGTIRYGKIRIEEGGQISGAISTLSATAPATVSTATAAAGTVTTPASASGPAPAPAPVVTPAAPAAPAAAAPRATQPVAAAAAVKEPAASTLHLPPPAPRGGKQAKDNAGPNTA